MNTNQPNNGNHHGGQNGAPAPPGPADNELDHKPAALVKPGDIVLIKGHPCVITDVTHAKAGKH
jgi:hypothetical protein